MIELAVLISGAVVMSFEILGSRILAPHFGNTVFVWGSLISVFLGGLTLGYWAGGKLADYRPDLRLFAALFAAPGVLLCLFPLFSDAVCRRVWDLDLDPRYGSLLASLILFFLPTLFLGSVSPYAIKLRIRTLRWLGTGVGNLYALSSLGSIVGTLVTTFYLISWAGVRTIILYEGILLLLVSAVLVTIGFYGRDSASPITVQE